MRYPDAVLTQNVEGNYALLEFILKCRASISIVTTGGTFILRGKKSCSDVAKILEYWIHDRVLN